MSRWAWLARYLVVGALGVALGAASSMARDMNAIMMSGGKMVVMEDGKKNSTLEQETILSDGTRVGPDGTIRRKDGVEIRLKQGEMIMMDGHIMHGGKASGMCH